MPDVLSTEHCNYIIWRYLQEFGYGATAVQLQREWRVPDPDKLPFSSAVGKHELVTLFNHALEFDDACCEYKQEPRRFKFLHEGYKRDELHPDESAFQSASRDGVESPRKRQKLEPGSSSTRQSKSKKSSATSQVGEAGGQLATYEALTPREEVVPEPPKPPPTTAELGADAQVQTDELPKPPVAKTLYKEKLEGADIIHLAFHPTDANVLETGGGSVLRKLRVISELDENGDDADGTHVEVEVSDISPGREKPFYITAYSRSPKGEQAALAVEHGKHRTISFGNGSPPQLGPMYKIVLSFQWDQAAKLILATMGAKDESGSALIWDNKNSTALAELSLDKPALGATWLSANRFALVGEGFLDLYRFQPKFDEDEEQSPVVLSKSIQTDLPWYTVCYDHECGLMACGSASEKGHLGVVEANSDHNSIDIFAGHDGPVSGLQWQPKSALKSQVPGLPHQFPLLASSSVDGTIKFWDVSKKPTCVYSFETEAAKAVVALAFSPDGKHVAAAIEDRTISIWEAKEDGKIVAVWSSNTEEGEHAKSNAIQPPAPAATIELNGNHVKENGVEAVNQEQPKEAEPKSEGLTNEQVGEPAKTNGETTFSPQAKDDRLPDASKPIPTPVQDINADNNEYQEEVYHTLSWNINCDKLAYGCGDMLSIIYLPQCRNEVYRLPRSSETKPEENIGTDSAPNLAGSEENSRSQDGAETGGSADTGVPAEGEVKNEANTSEQPMISSEDMSSAAKQAAVEATETKDEDVAMGNTEETPATADKTTNVAPTAS